jgi:hypothetical protein
MKLGNVPQKLKKLVVKTRYMLVHFQEYNLYSINYTLENGLPVQKKRVFITIFFFNFRKIIILKTKHSWENKRID